MRAASFTGARSMMKVRATRGDEVQSFRAQLVVNLPETMELIAYTPVGTTALTIRAEGDRISYTNHLEGTTVKTTAEDLARSLGFYTAELKPYEMAMLLLGLPPRRELSYEASTSGLAKAAVAEVTISFDPPQFPPRKVTVTRGADTLEIEHLETIATKR